MLPLEGGVSVSSPGMGRSFFVCLFVILFLSTQNSRTDAVTSETKLQKLIHQSCLLKAHAMEPQAAIYTVHLPKATHAGRKANPAHAEKPHKDTLRLSEVDTWSAPRLPLFQF